MIEYKRQKYDSIEQFDCRVISLKYKEGGGFFTCIPISPLAHRKTDGYARYRHELPSVTVTVRAKDTTFTMVDDWGHRHKLKIDNSHSEEIASAIESARKEELLK